jgi:hypothetical protein
MPDQAVYVIREGTHWLVKAEGKRPEHFATRDAALRAALMLADNGQPIDVRVEAGAQMLSFRATPTFQRGNCIGQVSVVRSW